MPTNLASLHNALQADLEQHGSTAASCPPVLLLGFNRPDSTKRVLEVLRRVRPSQVFFAVDGPRAGRGSDAADVRAVCDLAATIDWDCNVRTLFRDRNLGCKRAVSEAISWFFGEVDSGIILEDDCLPSLSFFRFCEVLLDRFRDDARVFSIQGNFFGSPRALGTSYVFSKLFYMWGWASWADRWRRVRIDDVDTAGVRRALVEDKWLGSSYWRSRYWVNIAQQQAAGQYDSWGYPVALHCLRNRLFNVTPTRNLVLNVGVGGSATTTEILDCGPFFQEAQEIEFPLVDARKYEGSDQILPFEYRWRVQVTRWRLIREVIPGQFPRSYRALRAAYRAFRSAFGGRRALG